MSGKASWGPDYMTALKSLGYVDERIDLQEVAIVHACEDFSQVTIKCHIGPDDFKAIADYVARQQ